MYYWQLLLQLFLFVFSSFLFSFFLSHRFLLGASHAQCNHHSRIDRTMNKVFAHRELRGLSELRDWREIDYCVILARYFLCLSYSAGSSTFRLSFLFSSLSLCNFMCCLWSIAFSFLPLGTIHSPWDVRLCPYVYKNCACFAVVKTDSAGYELSLERARNHQTYNIELPLASARVHSQRQTLVDAVPIC